MRNGSEGAVESFATPPFRPWPLPVVGFARAFGTASAWWLPASRIARPSCPSAAREIRLCNRAAAAKRLGRWALLFYARGSKASHCAFAFAGAASAQQQPVWKGPLGLIPMLPSTFTHLPGQSLLPDPTLTSFSAHPTEAYFLMLAPDARLLPMEPRSSPSAEVKKA